MHISSRATSQSGVPAVVLSRVVLRGNSQHSPHHLAVLEAKDVQYSAARVALVMMTRSGPPCMRGNTGVRHSSLLFTACCERDLARSQAPHIRAAADSRASVHSVGKRMMMSGRGERMTRGLMLLASDLKAPASICGIVGCADNMSS